jgi:hypothetical protein
MTTPAGDWLNPFICIGSLGILVLVVAVVGLRTLFGFPPRPLPHLVLDIVRTFAAAFAVFYAPYCALQLYANVAIKKGIEAHFAPTLVFISIFWVIVPPAWFFAEYFVLDSDAVSKRDKRELARVKIYADYASKIWAGVVTVLAGLIALNQKG